MLTERFFDIAFIRKSMTLRAFSVGAWLGWQIESNWADPFLFAIYSIARPISSALILVVMYNVITGGATEEPIFAYIYLGNALYILVSQVIAGVAWTVIDDRERYRVNKQMHTMPMNYYAYLMGRGMARLIIGFISVTITILFGVLMFKLPLVFDIGNWLLFWLSTVLGIISLACLGLIIGSLTMMMARHFWAIGEAVAAALYLFTGAIFPLDVLPLWLRPIGFAFPVTYWLEVARRAMLGPNAATFPTLSVFSNLELIGILAGFCVVLGVVSVRFYRWALHQAKEKGMIDMETTY